MTPSKSNDKKKVLVVDDLDSIRKLIRPILIKELGFISENIFEAPDGRAAFDLLKRKEIDLVICEWGIPKISGIDLLKMIRADITLTTVPFVMITSFTDQQHIMQAVTEKVSQYLVRPFSAESLRKKLESIRPPPGDAVNKSPSKAKKKSSLKILIADDEFTSRQILMEVMSKYGKCHVAVDGHETVSAFAQSVEEADPYDLICMDIVMPVLDGLAALEEIRRIEKSQGVSDKDRVKIIAITAYSDTNKEKEEAIISSTDAYLTKPVHFNILNELVANLFKT